MIAEIRIRYAVHALLLGLCMFSSIFCFLYPWFYVVRAREGLTYTSLWSIDGIQTTETAREFIMERTTQSWAVAGFPTIGRTFHLCFLLALAGLVTTFVQFVCICLMSFFVRRCLYNLRVWGFVIRNIYTFLAVAAFALFGSSTFYFLKTSMDLQVDQSEHYRGMPCLPFSPCFQFIGTNTENSAYVEWGPMVGWCADLGACLFSFLTILSSFLLQGRLKIRQRRNL